MKNYFGYIYKTTDLQTGLIYVGKHAKSFFDTNYYGSGKIMQNIIKKCKMNKIALSTRLVVEQIDFAYSLEELNAKEKYWIAKLNARDKQVGYNIGVGGEHNIEPGTYRGEEYSLILSAAFNDKIPANNGIEWHWFDKDKIPDGWVIGELPCTKENYEKRAKKRKQTVASFQWYTDGSKNYFLDPNSEKAQQLTIGFAPHTHDYNKNKICITDGHHRKYIYPTEQIPDGWWKGDYYDQSLINHNTIGGKVWITNGEVEKYIWPEEELPEGFWFGRKSRRK